MPMRWFLPIWFVAAMLTLVVYRGVQLRRRAGVSALTFDRGDPLDGYIARILLATEVGVIAHVAAYAIGGRAYAALVPLVDRVPPWLELAGALVLGAALVWAVVAQAQMGASWRIGIDRDRPTELVTRGVFRLSRNPIFLAMRVCLVALFVCAPNALSLATAVVGNVVIQVQVRLEEKHLEALHGEVYRSYLGRVRRWI